MFRTSLVKISSRFGSNLEQVSSVAKANPAFTRAYDEKVIDHYERPRNVGSFEKGNNIGTGLVGAPACGDVMRLQIQVDDKGNIVDSCFKTFGCGSAIASSSVATEWIKGKNIEDAMKIQNRDIAKHLNLPPVKLHCSMLAEDAIKAAINDINSRRNFKKASPTVASFASGQQSTASPQEQ